MHISKVAYHKVDQAWWLLKLTYGIVFIVAALDKFTNIIVPWSKYISPLVIKLLPFVGTAKNILYLSTGIEFIIGLLLLSPLTRLGAWLATAWLVIMALNLVTFGVYHDLAIRDLVMAVGALALALITKSHQEHANK